MKRQTKNIITREWVEKELRFYNTADIRSSLVLCGALSPLFLALTFMLVYGAFAVFDAIWLKIVVAVLTGVIISSPVWIHLIYLYHRLAERKKLLRGEFDITIRPVSQKREKIIYRHLEEFLYFEDFEEISVQHTTFQLASPGDDFYIVHYKGGKLIKLFYPLKTHEYKEL